MSVRIFITKGTTADCRYASQLIDGICADALLADYGYDTDSIVTQASAAGMDIVIPPKINRREQREYGKDLYKLRHLVENAFLHLKRWRGAASNYAKNMAPFLVAVHIRFVAIWLSVLT